jgi:hypothetical protein
MNGGVEQSKTIHRNVRRENIGGIAKQAPSSIDLQRILSILLQVGERPRTINELGLTREDALELVRTGYLEWKRVVYPTERGREIARWLLKAGKEDEVSFFETVKREAEVKLASRGNKFSLGIKAIRPIHIHVMKKIREGQQIFHEDIENRALKQLIKWELVKKAGSCGIIALTRLGQEFLTCFEQAATSIRPITYVKEVMEKR